MIVNSERQRLTEQFTIRVSEYKDAIRSTGSGDPKIRKIFRNLKQFGPSYVLYTLARFNVPGLWGSARGKLFWGRNMVWPASDIGTHVFSMYGIAHHKSERRLTRWMINYLKEDDVFYDIGAHLGFYTALSELIAVHGETHAFEANKKLCDYLNRNFAGSHTTYISCNAASDMVGSIDFYDATRTEDSSASSRFNISERGTAPFRVPATTIDAYVKAGHRPPTVIKLDIEGGEYEAIVGGSGVIKTYRPAIIMEVWAGDKGRKYSDKAVRKLQELGYNAFELGSDGSVSKNPVDDPVGSIKDASDGARDNFLFITSEQYYE